MNYLSYLQEELDENIVEELQFNYTSGTQYVLKYLGGGANFKDSTFQPIQIIAYTNDVDSAFTALATFAKNKSNSYFKQDLETVKQNYSTPIVLGQWAEQSTNWASQIVVNGTLIISTDIVDITQVKIDGEVINTVSATLTYTGQADSQRSNSDNLNKSNIQVGSVQLTITLENKNNNLQTKMRRLRQNNLDVDDDWDVVLTFTDNESTESYTMKLTSQSLNTDNQTVPVANYTFVG